MKTKIKRHSRAVLSIVLTLCMLVSCMTVGIIATDAAKSADERVGAAGDWYIVGNVAGANNWSERDAVKLSAVTDGYSISVQLEKDKDFRLRHNYKDYGAAGGTDADRKVNSSTSDHDLSQNSQTFIWTGDTGTYTVTINSDGTKISFDSSVPGGGGGEGGGGGTSETWTVAGSSATIFGTAWSPSTTSNDMTLTDTNTYVKSYTNVTDINNFQFKIAKDHAWGTAYPSNNFQVNRSSSSSDPRTISTTNSNLYWESGDTLTFTFNSSTQAISVTSVNPESSHAVTFSADPAAGGSVNPASGTKIGEVTATQIEATPNAGYQFSGWEFGNGITYSTAANPMNITTKSSGTYSVQANFSKKNLNVTVTQPDSGGTIYSDKSTAQIGDTVTVTATPAAGYSLSSISYSSTAGSGTATGTGDTRTFIMPGADTTVTATFGKINYTVSKTVNPTGSGTVTVKKTNASGESVSQYNIGDTLYLTASPAAAYTFNNFTVTYGDGTTDTKDNNTTIDMTGKTGDITVQGNFTAKPTHTITVNTNNLAYGTASASVASAYQGQEVTLTATVNSGVFKKWTVTSGTMSTVNDKTDNPLTFTMGDEDLTITANFDEYTAVSPFYYNSYGSNGQPVATHYGAQMTEAKLNGETFSYYHVTGRTESDQLFTVSYGSPKYNSYNTYFEIYKSWENGGVSAQFYATDGKNLGGWAGMTFDGDDGDKKRFRIAIPDGAREVEFKNNNGGATTGKQSLANGNNAFYVSGSNLTDVTGYVVGINPVPVNFYENFNSNKYTDAFSTKGFNSHYANRGENHGYTKPKDLGSTKGDYYIVVLYENKTYTINGVNKKITNNPEIIWLPELPDESSDTVKVYAKDGAIAGYGQTYADLADTTVLKADGTTSAGATKYTSTGNQTYEVYKAQRGETITIKTTIGLDKDGNPITSPTADSLRSKYYVRGFMVNGEVPKGTLITIPDTTNGVYTLTYTVPEDFEGKYIEITPVYYLVNTSTYPVVTFRATDFPKNQYKWGDTPYVYPFYGKLGGYNNAFGVYAGQPMIFYNGQYSIQIPQKSTAWALDSANLHGAATTLAEVNNISVSGVTMSNGYYDTIHKLIMGYGNNGASADHVQTYDYGDFYKIFNEKKPVDNIVFDFKYRTTTHNLETNAPTTLTPTNFNSTYKNGFELLKNFHGRNVDIFGNALSGDAADASKTKPLYVVSIGGVNGSNGVENIAGYYATEWKVYAPYSTTGTPSASETYKLISGGNKTSIPPEVLVLNDDDTTSFNTTTYPSADANHVVTDWKDLYTALEAYRGRPVMISYEAADAQIGAGNYATSGSGGATRNDGRWLYSKNGESITSKIRVDVSHDSGATYVTNPAEGETGYVDGLSAYFTNADVYQKTTYATTIDPDKTFNFEAKTTNGSYKFVGWYLDDSSKTLITNDNAGSTERSGSYTFVARFMEVSSGQLILSHSTDTGTIGGTNYDGAGTVTIAAVVKDGDGATVKTFDPTTSDITLDNKIIKSDNIDYTVNVTLTATRGNNSALGTTILATPVGQESEFFNYGNFTVSADGKTRTYNFTFSVGNLYSGITQNYMSLIYHSYFKNYVFNYTVNYEFTGRDGEKKIYNRAGTLTAPQAEAYVYKDTVTSGGSEIDMRFLRKEFFESLAPYESNFRQSLTWNFTNKQFTDGTNYVYNCNAHFEAIQNDSNEKVNVTFVLPYEHNNGVATLNNGVGIAATKTNFELINDGTNDNRVEFGKIPKLLNNAENGIYTAEEKIHWIAAPTKLSNGNFFSHWSIKTTDSDVEVAKCYFPGFNFLAYENYVIEAIYVNAESDYGESGIYTNATYLSTTRNQWNAITNADGSIVGDVAINNTTNASDVLYNDFVLNYHYKDVNIYKNDSTSNDIKELGIVVERVKELDKNSDDSYDTRISSYSSLAENETNVTNVANDSTVKDGGSKKIDGLTYYKQRINKNQLDNKNRILFYEAFYNAAGWDSKNQKPAGNYTAKRYVYRAYTYITYTDINDVTQTVLSEKPAYFIMYDVATAKYSSN